MFQYISIAKKYLNSDFTHAINGYWSPLISWLLIIPIAVFDDSITAFKMLQLAIGLFVLFQWNGILMKSKLSALMKYMLAIISVPFLISYSLLNCTPDLLFMGMILWLINIFLSGNVTTDPAIAIRAGITGGLMYFTKAFGLPLFIAISIFAILFEGRKEKLNIRAVTLMYLFFSIICLIWISKISFHYNEFTINKSISFNRSLNANMLNGTEELPVLGSGILKPMEGDLSAWEAPGEYVIPGNPNNFYETFKRNILSIYYFDFSRQIGIIFLLLLFMFIYRKGKEVKTDKWLFLLLSTLIFVYAGYSLVLVHSRYIWINTFIMLVLSSVFIQQLISNRIMKVTLYSFFFMLAIKRPIKEIFFLNDKDYPSTKILSALIHPFETLDNSYEADKRIQGTIKLLHKIRLPKSKFVSVKPGNYQRDTYTASLRITESLDAVYYGEIKTFTDSTNQIVSRDQINYLIAYEEIPASRQLFYDEESGIRIYDPAAK